MKSRWSESWSQYDGLINSDDIVIRNVRQRSNAGWFVGALQVYPDGHCECYSKDSYYYPTEEMCIADNRGSKSIEEAFEQARVFNKI